MPQHNAAELQTRIASAPRRSLSAPCQQHSALALLFATVLLCGCDRTPSNQRDGDLAHSPPEVALSLSVASFFRDEANERGIAAPLRSGKLADYAMPDIMGGGVALLDFDRDGDIDIALANAIETSDSTTQEGNPGFVLYRQDRNGRFEPVTQQIESAPLPDGTTAAGFAVGDVNNDGRPDLYLTAHGEDRLFLNDTTYCFRNVTAESGISNPNWGTSACFVDYDRDGWLDLFVTNYVDYSPRECVQLSGSSRDFCSPSRFAGTVDRLFRNVTGESPNQSVRFEDVTYQAGIGMSPGKGLGVVAADLTADGWPDLYVANDQEQNSLWVNQRDGRFREEALVRGCALDALGNAQASMGIVVHDFDRDGRLDLLVTHLSGERNTLYRALPDGTFTDLGAQLPACNSSLPFTGFGIAVFDIDGDGHDEAFVANGLVRRPDGVPQVDSDFWAPYRQPDTIYSGFSGSDTEPAPITQQSSPLLSISPDQQVSRSLAVGDLDADGDLDLVITSLDASPRILINTVSTGVRKLRILPVLPQHGGRCALGAVVTARSGQWEAQQLVHRAGSYLSSQMPIAEFIERPGQLISDVLIIWPDGLRETFRLPRDDDRSSIIVLAQGTGITANHD